jgi:predicted small lipoprotein YifL
MRPNAMFKLLLVMSLFSFLGCGHKRPVLGPELDKNVHVQSLYFSATHGYHAYSNIGYKAERLENGNARVTVEVGNDRDRVFEAEGSLMDSLEALVREYRMNTFTEHYQPKWEVLDGDSWSMEICYTDGSSNSCGGYMAYPPNGAAGIHKTEALLSRWLYQEPAEEIGLVSFHYEVHDAEGSEVYECQLKDTVCTAFVQAPGQAKGQKYEGVDPYLAKSLANEIRWNHMGSYTGENLQEENKTRPRWILKVEYENGQKIEAMDYFDRPVDESWRHDVPSISEMALRHSTQQAFSEKIQQLEEKN